MNRPVVTVSVLALLCGVMGGFAQDRKADSSRRDLALWAAIKRSLTAPDGEEYFRQNLKDAALPVMAGTLISATPADRPNVLVLAIADSATPEITLRVKDDDGNDALLTTSVARGSEIRFEGAVMAFTKEPFMLTVEVSPNLGQRRRK